MPSAARPVLIAALCLLLASCSSGDGESSANTAESSATTAGSASASTTASTENSEDEPTTTTEAETAAPAVVFEGSTSHVEVRSGRLRSITIELIAKGVTGTWTVETELSRGAGILVEDVPEGFEVDRELGVSRTLRVGATDEAEFIGTQQTIKLNVIPDDPANPSTLIAVNIVIVGPDDPVGPAVTDDIVVGNPTERAIPFNPLFNDNGGTDGLAVDSFTIEPVTGMEIGEGGYSDWLAPGVQSTTYEICDQAGRCRTGTVRFVLYP